MAGKSLGLYNLQADMGFDAAEDRLGSVEMRAVRREKKKGVATGSDGVLNLLSLVEPSVIH